MARRKRPPSAVARPLDPADPWGRWVVELSPDAVDVLRGLAGGEADRAPGIVGAVFAAGLAELGFAALLDPDPDLAALLDPDPLAGLVAEWGAEDPAALLAQLDDGPDLAALLDAPGDEPCPLCGGPR